MEKREFHKLTACFEVIALLQCKKDKKALLSHNLFDFYSADELNKFIEETDKQKKLLVKRIKDEYHLSYNEIINFAKEKEPEYKDLYNLLYCYRHNYILSLVKDRMEEFEADMNRYYKPTANDLFSKYVLE